MPKTLQEMVSEARAQIKEIGPQELQELMENEDLLIVDVREPDEYRAGHLPGAINIPRGLLELKVDNLATPGDEILVLY